MIRPTFYWFSSSFVVFLGISAAKRVEMIDVSSIKDVLLSVFHYLDSKWTTGNNIVQGFLGYKM